MKKLFKIPSPPVNNNITCIKKGYMDNGINLYPSQECYDIFDECHHNFNPNNELLGQLQEMYILSFAFSNCSKSFK